MTSPKTYTALAVFQSLDAVACAAQVPPIKKSLDSVGCPELLKMWSNRFAKRSTNKPEVIGNPWTKDDSGECQEHERAVIVETSGRAERPEPIDEIIK